jgi:phenylacetate-CoA ligase
MDLAALRRLVPAPLQGAVEAVLFPGELREARRVKALLARSLLHADEASAADYQRRRLQALLARARADVPYYAEVLAGVDLGSPACLAGLPLLDKELIRRNAGRLVSRRAGALGTFRFNTGGSTGEPLQFLASRAAGLVDRCHGTFLFELGGYVPGDRIAAFDGNAVPEELRRRGVFWRRRRRDLPYGSVHFSSHYFTPGNEDRYLEAFLELRPAFLRGYPSFIAQVAEALARRGHRPAFVKAVHVTAETVFDHQVAAIERALGCPVYRQYGHSEMAVFGFCLPGEERYLCSPYVGVTEVLDPAGRQVAVGEEGEIVVTGLHNAAMPLVRYRTGDRAVYGGRDRGFTVLARMQGRTQDVLYGKDGSRIAVTGLIFGQHFHAFGRIARWQLVQERAGEVEARIVRREGFGPEDEREVLAKLSEGERLLARVTYVEDIDLTLRGKLAFVVNRVAPPPA